MNSEDYAIIIAINLYPAFDVLTSPAVDALEFQKWLLLPTGGNVPPGNIALIQTPAYTPPAPGDVDDPTLKPTLNEVDIAFRKHVETAYSSPRKGNRVGRRLYMFMSGHGITPGRSATPGLDDSALLMANANMFSLGLHLPGQPYAEWFRQAGAFDELILFMDCCRDDAGTTAPRNCPFPELKGDPNRVNTFYALASQWGLSAWEGIVDPVSQSVRSYFSYALLEALNGTRDALGKLTGNGLAGYIKTRVSDLCKDKGQVQVPQFHYDPQNDIVLVDGASTLSGNVTIKIGSPMTDDVVLFGASLQRLDANPVSNGNAATNPWIKPLDSGLYKLQSGAKFQYFEVPANKGNVDVQFT